MTGIHVFDETLQTSHQWLKTLMRQMETDDPEQALRALRAALHAIRDDLTTQEISHLAAQLPMLLRGLLFEGWRPDGRRPGQGDLVGRIALAFSDRPAIDARQVARHVVAMLAEHISIGALGKLVHALPDELRAIWASERQTLGPPAPPA